MKDLCCSLPNTAPVTAVFSKYTISVNMLYRRSMYPGWSKEDIQTLELLIQTFKHEAFHLFRKYHPSGFNTTKWHMWDHVISDTRRVGFAI